MTDIEEIRLEEYRSLLEEHRKNRSYIFERPIIILGIVAATMQYFYESTIGQFVLAGLIFILMFNLWFIGHRIRSDARIVAYIQLVHEGELRTKYFGWENALRQYRKWMMHHKKTGDLELLRLKKLDSEAVPDRIVFYPAIWLLHFVLVLLTFIVTLAGGYPFKTVIASLGINAISVAAIIFMIFAIGFYNPKQLKVSIELERATWLCVFEEIQLNKISKE